MQKNKLQNEWQRHIIEQEICWAQRAHHNWISMKDKNTKFFQVTATIRKRKNYIRQIMDENGIWSEDQNLIL